MYRTSSVLALGLFLGLAPAGLNAQTQTQEPAAQQETQQQQDQQVQQDQQQQVQQDQQVQPDQQRTTGLLATDQQSLLVDTMIGSNVYSPDDENIGSIDDVLITVDGEVGGVVIGVGGWLGVGQRDVLVQMDDLLLDTRDGEFRLVMQRTREELEAEPEFRRVHERDTAMMQQDTTQPLATQPPATQQQTAQQQDQQAGVQQDTIQQDTMQQDQQAYQQADQELQQASQSIEQGDAERARQSLTQAREHMQQAFQQAQPEQQQALEQANESMQQAEQSIDQGEAQQAQQSVEQAREQLQVAMQGTAPQDTVQQDTVQQDTVQQQPMTQQDTVVGERPRDGRVVFQDERSILASTMIGSNVHSAADEDMGSINDIIVSMDGQVEGVVIGVGGFLGIGQKDVVIGMDGLDIQRDADDEVRVNVIQSREDLEAAPGFERPRMQQ
jgi:hypothetical protein